MKMGSYSEDVEKKSHKELGHLMISQKYHLTSELPTSELVYVRKKIPLFLCYSLKVSALAENGQI